MKAIMNYLVELNSRKEHGVDLSKDKMAMQRLKEVSRKS